MIMVSNKDSMTYIRMQDAINHIQDFSAFIPQIKRISNSISQNHLFFRIFLDASRVHFDLPQKLSHRPTISFSSSLGRTTPPIFALNVGEITSLETKVLYSSGSSPNSFFQKKLCASIFVADFL